MRAEQVVVIGNERGIHGRVATRLAGMAASHGVHLFLRHGEETVECSSILDVLALALARGTAVGLVAEGAQAESALAAAIEIINAQDDSDHDPPG
ncbi:HPr family phosphocarrier protein [Desulfobulbus elongatus]|uniref:HPr family phosphocarrier protein n=1 Tax=Desulfobulbus elongatus TaxID=53332 RepID=UPI000684EE9E|nr:HPr family phosphocarrier protein [Desulfobulbus elongatus]